MGRVEKAPLINVLLFRYQTVVWCATALEQRIIGLAVAIKVRHARDSPADRKSGAVQTGA